MKIAYVPVAAIVAVLAAGVAHAKSPSTYNGTVKVTGGSSTAGACTDADPHANLCPSGVDCMCETFTGTYTGTAGKGTAGGVGTLDEGLGFAPEAGDGAGCSPLFAVIRITGKKDTETFEYNGYSCLNLNGSISGHGGCVMSSSTKFAEGAIVTCSGSGPKAPGIQTFTLSGLAVK